MWLGWHSSAWLRFLPLLLSAVICCCCCRCCVLCAHTHTHRKDLFKPLRVHFIGEEGIDAGGVKKEFFQLLVGELLSPDYGMLVYQPESHTYW